VASTGVEWPSLRADAGSGNRGTGDVAAPLSCVSFQLAEPPGAWLPGGWLSSQDRALKDNLTRP